MLAWASHLLAKRFEVASRVEQLKLPLDLCHPCYRLHLPALQILLVSQLAAPLLHPCLKRPLLLVHSKSMKMQGMPPMADRSGYVLCHPGRFWFAQREGQRCHCELQHDQLSQHAQKWQFQGY